MPTDVLMPPLSQTMDTMVLVEWLKKPGDAVQKGEPLFLVESDKATLEVESPASGTVADLLVEAGAEVPVMACVARIRADGEAFEPPAPADKVDVRTGPASDTAVTLPAPSAVFESPGDRIPLPAERATRIFASPRARQAARAASVTLDEVVPTGPQGLIVERDVLEFAQARRSLTGAPTADGQGVVQPDAHPAAEGASAGIPLEPTRRAIARRLSLAHQTMVPVTLTRECDATAFVALRTRIVAGLGAGEPRPTVTDLLAVIAARCLRRHPALNGTFDGERVYPSHDVHLALAVDTERGLLAPVIRSCDSLGLMEVAAARLRLVEATRTGTIAGEELAGGTFTLTNLGPERVDAFTPVVNPPQIAILGVGRIRSAAAVWNGQIAVRQLLILSLTFDHRIVDGAPAARFLDDVARLIEDPDRMWLLPG